VIFEKQTTINKKDREKETHSRAFSTLIELVSELPSLKVEGCPQSSC